MVCKKYINILFNQTVRLGSLNLNMYFFFAISFPCAYKIDMGIFFYQT